MGVNSFVFFLFIGSVIFMFSDIETIQDEIQSQEKPMVSFYNSTSYSINKQAVVSIVKSSEAYLYKKREEMVDATLLSRDEKNSIVNFIKSNFAIKVDNDVYFDGNIFFQSGNGINLTTEQLEYDIKNKIIRNSVPFEVEQHQNIYKGTDIYFDLEKSLVKAKNIQFGLKEKYD